MLRISPSVFVERNEGHPENYLWILVGGQRFFLGVLTPGMTRADVKRMALDHPQLNRSIQSGLGGPVRRGSAVAQGEIE